MLLTILGLGITTLISLISMITTEGRKRLKSVLAILTVLGFSLGIWSAERDSRDKEDALQALRNANMQLASTNAQLASANDQLATLQQAMALVKFVVGDLGRLNELSGGAHYYVRVAADSSRERLEPFLRAIEREFKGAASSGMVSIREPRVGSHNYELVFGQGLDVSAAEVFHRLAVSHHLTPISNGGQEVAAIVPEPATR
jgi:hypothetical protein